MKRVTLLLTLHLLGPPIVPLNATIIKKVRGDELEE
jgi:hypothetical protein